MNPALARHLQTLGLERSPFPPTPDAASYYATPMLEGELVEAAHALRTRTGFVLLTGEVGTGKSTFLRRLLGQLETDGIVVSLVFNTFLQGDDLLAAILRDFGMTPKGNAATDIEILNRFLISRWQDRTTCVLIIDDAQNLTLASLELVRLLTSLETGQEKLLQIVLSGQPELRDNLDQPQIRQLTSRICKHVRLEPLDLQQTRAYVDFRLAAAGAAKNISVQPAAAVALHRCSKGNPRRIHLIMDRCLYGLYALPQGQRQIDTRLVRSAAAQSGVHPARRDTPRNRMAIAASVLLASALGLTGLLIGSNESRADSSHGAVASNAVTSTPAAAASAARESWAACLRRNANPRQRHDTVSERAALALGNASDVCRQQRNGAWEIAWNPPPDARRFEDPASVEGALQQLQQQLTALGHYDGAIDGQFGRLTQRALARFQQDTGLPPSGQVDPLTLRLLQDRASNPTPLSRTTESLPHDNG